MLSYISPLLFYLHRFYFLSRSTHTINYVIILLLMYLHPELLLLLHLPFDSTNFPHLITLHLDLAGTKSKYPYFIALLDLSYLTYRISWNQFWLPYSWHNHTFCLSTSYIIVLLNFKIHFLFTSFGTLFIYPLVMSYFILCPVKKITLPVKCIFYYISF
jgi:hypothetical protein